MTETKQKPFKNIILYTLAIVVVSTLSFQIFRPRIDQSKFQPIDKNSWKDKTVANYFIEKLRMTPQEAQDAEELGASFYVTKNMTLDALISNLRYYGLVQDERALRYALENSDDTNQGKEDAIRIGKNTIDRGVYGLGTQMTAWEVARILLNYPQEVKTDYGYMFMPGGPYMGEPQGRPTK
jgi:hypothetical protein